MKPKEDLTGRVVNHLTVIGYTYVPARYRFFWNCRCVCGAITRKTSYDLTSGTALSCGCQRKTVSKMIDLTGQKFGKLTVISPAGRNRWNAQLWRCQCDCGGIRMASGAKMRSGEIKSCGCTNTAKHGMHNTKTYRAWLNMKAHGEHDPRWDDFHEFLADMGEGMPGEKFVRVDKSKPYSMENCEWQQLQKLK